MNRIIRTAVIFITLFLSPAAFAAEKANDINTEKNIKQDVIILDVTKTNQDGVIEEGLPVPDSVKKRFFEKFENDDKDQAQDNVDNEFSIFDNLIDRDDDSEHPFKIEEDSLFGKIIHKKLERTSIPSFLLQEELSRKYKKGPVSKVQFYGAYQGSLNGTFSGGDYDTEYEYGIIDVGVVGSLKKELGTDFKLQLNLKPSSKSTYLQGLVSDAYFMNTKIPHHKIIVGNSRNQIGVEGGANSYTLPFVMRSQISRNFASTRALGVRVVGNYSLADYSFALNSSDRYFREFFPGLEFTGWVNLKPLGKTDGRYGSLVVGGGLNAGHNNTNYTVGGAYVNYTYKKFMTNFEYSIADGYNGSYVSTDKATGFYSTVSYRLTKKLHVLARYDQFDPNRDVTGNMRREYTTGFNYFIKGQALRLILNYVFCDNEDREDSHRIILGTQILL